MGRRPPPHGWSSAAAALAVAACGGQPSPAADAITGDAAADAAASPRVDAPPDDAPSSAPITVSVFGFGGGAGGDPAAWGPYAGWSVYVQDAATSPTRVVTTGADGLATAYVAAGGFVTVEDPFQRAVPPAVGTTFDTWAGVEPGDHLVLTDAPAPWATVAIALAADAGATSYRVETSCGAGSLQGPTGTLTMTGCPAHIDVAVVTSDGSGPRKTLVSRDLPFDGTGPIDLSSMTYTPYAPISRHLAVSGGAVATAFGGVITTAARLPSLLRDRATLDPLFVNAKNGALVADQALLYPLPGTDLLITTHVEVGPADGTGHVLELSTWKRAGQTDPVLIDVAPMQPPWIAAPTYDPATRTVTWTTSGAGPAADYVLTQLVVARTTTTAVGWDVLAPAAGDAVALPVFPLGDATTIEVASAAAHADTDGYDAARPRLFSPAIQRASTSATGFDASVSAPGIAGQHLTAAPPPAGGQRRAVRDAGAVR